MDITSDYKAYVKEQQPFLSILKMNGFNYYHILEQYIRVLNKMASEDKLIEDQEFLFSEGFFALKNCIDVFKQINSYFGEDLYLLKKYDNAIFYYVLFDDISIAYKDEKEHKKTYQLIQKTCDEIYNKLINKGEFSDLDYEKYEDTYALATKTSKEALATPYHIFTILSDLYE